MDLRADSPIYCMSDGAEGVRSWGDEAPIYCSCGSRMVPDNRQARC